MNNEMSDYLSHVTKNFVNENPLITFEELEKKIINISPPELVNSTFFKNALPAIFGIERCQYQMNNPSL
jgi:hypothetical protein